MLVMIFIYQMSLYSTQEVQHQNNQTDNGRGDAVKSTNHRRGLCEDLAVFS